jgi:hypothetical protein
MPGRDLSAELFGNAPSTGGRDLSTELFDGQPAPSGGDSTLGRLAAGAALGISDIGNTALNALTYLPGKVLPNVAQWNRTRNADFEALTEQNKDSTAFKVGRIGGDIATTLPVGGILGQGVRTLASLPQLATAAPQLGRLASAVASGGMRTGSGVTAASPLAARIADMGTRAAGGALSGGASAALVNPDDAGAGAVIGSLLPGAAKLAGAAGSGISSLIGDASTRLMQSAIKPTIAQLKSGDAATAVRTLLDYGINPTVKGVQTLRDKIGGLNDQIADMISNSPATVSRNKVVKSLDDVRRQFGTQVSPTSDLNAIQGVAEDFMAHPGIVGDAIPVADAQAMKQGTYRVLAKKYGQIGSADTEAQKALARGLKEEIAGAVPGVQGLNAEESRLISTLNVAERRALMELNKNPMGLASLASNPTSWAAFMMDKSALFKSLAARSLNATASGLQASGSSLENLLGQPLARSALPLISVRRE